MGGRFAHASVVAPIRGAGEDRVRVVEAHGAVLVVVADGAGGTSGGAAAAERVIAAMGRTVADGPPDAGDLVVALVDLDRELAGDPEAGETTSVVVWVDETRVIGASVGDSEAWVVNGESVVRLTDRQTYKPLLGDGGAQVRHFEHGPMRGWLVVGSDGLFKYINSADLCACLLGTPEEVTDRLLDRVTLPNGQRHDDVAIVAVRRVD